MPITGIDHVQLAAPPGNEAIARSFFGTLLGLTEVEKPGALRARGGVWFQCGTQQLHIGVQKDFSPATKAHPAFYVEDLHAFRIRLVAAGVEVVDDNSLPGYSRFYIEDPFGNRLELLEANAT